MSADSEKQNTKGESTESESTRGEEKPVRLMLSSLVVSAVTMGSRVMGLIRDIVFARVLGADELADAFLVAFKIPNFLRRLFAEGAFSQAFVPVLSEFRSAGDRVKVKHFINRVAGCLGLSLMLLSAIVVLCLWGFRLVGIASEQTQVVLHLLSITFPYIFLISMAGFVGAILNSYDRFAVPAAAPIILNIVLILFATALAKYFVHPVYALAWGVLAAGVLQLSFQLPFILRIGLLPVPIIDWRDSAVRRVLALMAPAMFGVSVSQINLLFDTLIAYLLPTGSVAWLYFSDRLTELPLGVFGVGIATVILPNLSRAILKDKRKFSAMLDWALRMVLFIAVPAAVALVMLAEPILSTLFMSDKVQADDIAMIALSLKAYTLGLAAFMLIKVLVSGYFSRQDTRTPVRIGIIAMVVNMGLNVLFVVPLHYYLQIGHVGLALATALSAWLNAALLFRGLIKDGVYQFKWSTWQIYFVRLAGAVLLMSFVLHQFSLEVASFSVRQGVELVIACVCGFLVYAVSLFLLGVRRADFKH